MINYTNYKYTFSEAMEIIARRERLDIAKFNIVKEKLINDKRTIGCVYKDYPYSTPLCFIDPHASPSELVNDRILPYLEDCIHVAMPRIIKMDISDLVDDEEDYYDEYE